MKWYIKYLSVYNKEYNSVSPNIPKEIKKVFKSIQSDKPLITVSIIGFNEEKHLVSCLWSISEMICNYPIEIIGIDNNSTDKTAQIFQDCGVILYKEKRQSPGYARLCGLKNGKGKYHVFIDGDTIYPPNYVNVMIKALIQPNIVGVYSLWSFIPDKRHSRLGLFFYEKTRDLYLYLLSIKRPELCVRGMVFAFNSEIAQKVGIRTDIIRGEDGSLALELKKFGKVQLVYNKIARPYTGCDTIDKDGSLFCSFMKRIIIRLKKISNIFTSQKEYKDEKSNLINQKDIDEKD